MELPLFTNEKVAPIRRTFDVPNATITLIRNIWTLDERWQFFHALRHKTPWEQNHINIHGQRIAIPRLEAWYGDLGCTYTYSDVSHHPLPWTDLLTILRRWIEYLTEASFNSVLLNLYRSGNDSISYHSDNEPELGENPVIASLSLGATRKFKMKPSVSHLSEIPPFDIDLQDGDLFVMAGQTQTYWNHSVPKTRKQVEERINLTWRFIHPQE
jgi:alkylated DNA repair dioxygenase AlkB